MVKSPANVYLTMYIAQLVYDVAENSASSSMKKQMTANSINTGGQFLIVSTGVVSVETEKWSLGNAVRMYRLDST
ncbi:MAG: hypothetical protein EOO53_02645 [Gammaproteobacteria bacterium]|nr:MAG: hypothetical protein EOO53_02645 [Gammaproteobacteria bacterium]